MIKKYSPIEANLDVSFGLFCGPHHFVEPGFDLHTHDFIELVVVLGGRGIHLTSYAEYEIGAGDVFVIGSDTAHGFADSEGMEIVNFIFTQHFLEDSSRFLKQLSGYHALFVLQPYLKNQHKIRNRLHLHANDLKSTQRMVDSLNGEFQLRHPGYQTLVQAKWLELLTFLCRCFSAEPTKSTHMLRLANTMAYMEQNYAQPLALDGLAEMAYLSKNHLIRIFKVHFDQTPRQYLNSIRLERAKEMLKQGAGNITQIASEVGFTDSNYFSRLFKNKIGCSPSEYIGKFC